MYRVVIVDDEEPVLDSFSYILERECEAFALSGKARSGTEAVKLICEVKPDVVFMDIQMPGIDGIDAISEIRQQLPEIVFVLATAYERFDIAQKAIPLGVFSYLVKPISRKAFVSELDRVKTHLDRIKERNTLQLQDIKLLQKSKEELKNRLLGGLAWRNPTQEDWEVFSRSFSLGSDCGAIRLIEIVGEVSEKARDSIFGSLREKLQFKFNCPHCLVASRLLFYFPEDQLLDRVDRHLELLIAQQRCTSITVGRGGIYPSSSLSSSYSEALDDLRTQVAKDKNRRTERDEMSSICTALLKEDFARGVATLDDFSARIFRTNSFEMAKAKMVALFTLLWTNFDEWSTPGTHVEFNPAEAIMQLKDVDEWREWSTGALLELEGKLRLHRVDSLPYHLSKALSIIHRDYSHPIQLSSIAQACQITSSYLCRLFSEHLGTTFVEYITRYRIERATILLQMDGLSIKETALSVGFQDPNYFSRVFRRYVGVSPSDLIRTRKER